MQYQVKDAAKGLILGSFDACDEQQALNMYATSFGFHNYEEMKYVILPDSYIVVTVQNK